MLIVLKYYDGVFYLHGNKIVIDATNFSMNKIKWRYSFELSSI